MKFEFVFDPHCEYLGMTQEQWENLHGMKVTLVAEPIEEENGEE